MKQGFGHNRTRFTAVFAAISILAWGAAAATQVHTWTDENGVVHFSDSPHETGKSRTIELDDGHRPATSDTQDDDNEAAVNTETTGEAATNAGTEESPVSIAQQRRDRMAQQRKERREAQAETDVLCKRHQQRLEQVEPARRVLYTNAEGETVRMDDNQRVEMIEESKDFIANNCR